MAVEDVAVLSGSGADPSVVFSSDALGTTHEAGGEERGCCAPRIWARGDFSVIRSRDLSSAKHSLILGAHSAATASPSMSLGISDAHKHTLERGVPHCSTPNFA